MFTTVTYQTSEDHPLLPGRWLLRIRVNPEVLTFRPDGATRNTALGDSPHIAVTVPSTANRDAGGVRPRGVMIAWTGPPPTGYDPNGRIFVPIVREGPFREYKVGWVGTYRGSSFVIASKRPEIME